MRMLFALAWRNLWRNRRRTIITMLAVVFATLLSVVMRGVQLGTYESGITFSLRMFPGWMQIQPQGWLDNPVLQKSFAWTPRLATAIDGTAGITGAAPRITADGLLCWRDKSLGVVIHGVDPARERRVTVLADRIRSGRFPASDTSMEAVVGTALLENLGASIGDSLVLLAQGFDGSLGNVKVRVAGVLHTGAQDLDGAAVFMPLARVQEMLGMGGRINYVALACASVSAIADARRALMQRIDMTDRTVRTWDEVMPDFKQVIELDNVSGILFLGVLIVVVAFGILNTVLMSVTERFREFGVLLAMGMPHRMLAFTVFIETLLIAVIGLVLGNALAWGVTSWLAAQPISLGSDIAAMYEEFGFAPEIHTIVDFTSFANTTLSVSIIALISALWPLVRIWRLSPLGGIRYT